MALQLHESTYKEFFGSYRKMMPALMAEGRTPMSVADIMRRRLEVANSDDLQLRTSWLDNYFDTSDAVLYHTSGNAKVILDAGSLLAITPQDTLTNGALLINDDIYQRLDGPTFSRSDLPSGRSLAKQDVLTHPVWNALARDDKALLREYTNLVFTDAKERFGYEENMGIYLSATPETPVLRAWYVSRIINRSGLGGNFVLDYNKTRLVGVAPVHEVLR